MIKFFVVRDFRGDMLICRNSEGVHG